MIGFKGMSYRVRAVHGQHKSFDEKWERSGRSERDVGIELGVEIMEGATADILIMSTSRKAGNCQLIATTKSALDARPSHTAPELWKLGSWTLRHVSSLLVGSVEWFAGAEKPRRLK